MKLQYLLPVFLLAFILTGVSTPSANAGGVTIYRTQSSTAYFATLDMYINNKKVGSLKSGKVLRVSGPGGANKLKVGLEALLGSDSRTLSYKAKPGGNYFSVGWKDHLIAPYFHFEEITRQQFKKAQRVQATYKKEVFKVHTEQSDP